MITKLKTYTAIIAINALRKKYPDFRILVVVPTTALREQWYEKLNEQNLIFNIEVRVINTVVKHQWDCDLLVIDEIHRCASDQFSQVFSKVTYKLILGLTATMERLDGKEYLIKKYCPVVDEITQMEAVINKWISDYKEYQVLIEVDNIDEYKQMNREWVEHFEFFGYNFNLAMSMCGKDGWKNKLAYRDEICLDKDENKRKEVLQAISFHSVRFMQLMQKRKAFINNHPKKIEVAQKIIEHRPNSKIITFSNNVGMAEAISNGEYVYTGKTSKKKGRVMLEDFISGKINILNSCHKLNEGFDVPDISVGIILGTDSSEIKARQRRGRTIRKYGNKEAEIFYIIIKDTIESKWFQTSHKNDNNYITIDEQGLEQVLRGEQPTRYTPKLGEIMFRF